MGRWLRLAEDMRASGAYYEPRLDPFKLWWWYWSGRSVAEFMYTGGPVAQYGAIVPTPRDDWAEVGLLYVHPRRRGLGVLEDLFAELLQNKYAQGKNLFFVAQRPVEQKPHEGIEAASERWLDLGPVAKVGQRLGFVEVTHQLCEKLHPHIHQWLPTVGLEGERAVSNAFLPRERQCRKHGGTFLSGLLHSAVRGHELLRRDRMVAPLSFVLCLTGNRRRGSVMAEWSSTSPTTSPRGGDDDDYAKGISLPVGAPVFLAGGACSAVAGVDGRLWGGAWGGVPPYGLLCSAGVTPGGYL